MMKPKKYPTYEYEKSIESTGFKYPAGVDEAGRGCGAGPVVAAAVRIPEDIVESLEGRVRDSKKLSPKKREDLTREIVASCDVGVGLIDNDIIDKINILEATKMAMVLALSDLDKYDYVFIDGNFVVNEIQVPQRSMIKGDDIVLSIAAASVVAKHTRDMVMLKLHKTLPVYGWDRNKGYLTQEHIEAIQTYGPSTYHRLSFKRVGK